jgi:hypothetical protein
MKTLLGFASLLLVGLFVGPASASPLGGAVNEPARPSPGPLECTRCSLGDSFGPLWREEGQERTPLRDLHRDIHQDQSALRHARGEAREHIISDIKQDEDNLRHGQDPFRREFGLHKRDRDRDDLPTLRFARRVKVRDCDDLTGLSLMHLGRERVESALDPSGTIKDVYRDPTWLTISAAAGEERGEMVRQVRPIHPIRLELIPAPRPQPR